MLRLFMCALAVGAIAAYPAETTVGEIQSMLEQGLSLFSGLDADVGLRQSSGVDSNCVMQVVQSSGCSSVSFSGLSVQHVCDSCMVTIMPNLAQCYAEPMRGVMVKLAAAFTTLCSADCKKPMINLMAVQKSCPGSEMGMPDMGGSSSGGGHHGSGSGSGSGSSDDMEMCTSCCAYAGMRAMAVLPMTCLDGFEGLMASIMSMSGGSGSGSGSGSAMPSIKSMMQCGVSMMESTANALCGSQAQECKAKMETMEKELAAARSSNPACSVAVGSCPWNATCTAMVQPIVNRAGCCASSMPALAQHMGQALATAKSSTGCQGATEMTKNMQNPFDSPEVKAQIANMTATMSACGITMPAACTFSNIDFMATSSCRPLKRLVTKMKLGMTWMGGGDSPTAAETAWINNKTAVLVTALTKALKTDAANIQVTLSADTGSRRATSQTAASTTVVSTAGSPVSASTLTSASFKSEIAGSMGASVSVGAVQEEEPLTLPSSGASVLQVSSAALALVALLAALVV